MRLAVISDIHGNADALAAVLADVRAAAPDVVVNLGDCFSGPLDVARTADLLAGAGIAVTVRGNHDRDVFAPDNMDDRDRLCVSQGMKILECDATSPPASLQKGERSALARASPLRLSERGWGRGYRYDCPTTFRNPPASSVVSGRCRAPYRLDIHINLFSTYDALQTNGGSDT